MEPYTTMRLNNVQQHNNKDGSCKHNAERNQTTKQYILNDFIYLELKNRQNK